MRLLVYPPPLRGEILSSYVIRLAMANGLRPVRLTNLLGLGTFWKRDPDVSASPDEIAVIATAAGLSAETLMACSVMPLLGRLHVNPRPEASPRYLVMTGKHRGLAGVRGHPLCVACVRETGAVLREWRLTTTVVCERHGAALIDACPACEAPLHHARGHRSQVNRLRLVKHRPELCPECSCLLPAPEALDAVTLKAALRVQQLMAQATDRGTVEWSGLRLGAREFGGILESVMGLHYPPRAQTGQAKWRPETCGVRERLEVVAAVGLEMGDGLVPLLRVLRERGVRPNEVLRAPGERPEWYRSLILLALSTEGRAVPPVLTGRGTFQFSERQWRMLKPAIPPTPRNKRKSKPIRAVLCAWLTRNMKATRKEDWTGAWTGRVSYPAMLRRIRGLMEEGVLDAVIDRMLRHLPECSPALTAPETVYSLTRLGSRHADHLWTRMIEEALTSLEVEQA